MAYVTLDEAKHHLNVDSFCVDDDEYITMLIGVGEAFVEREICHRLADYAPDGLLAPCLKQAVLLVIGHYYANREPAVVGAQVHGLPMGVKYLAAMYRDYTG